MSFSDGTATLVLHGDLDLLTAALLSEKLTQALDKGPERLIFDMADVPFIDCASARAIVVAGRALPGGGRPVLRSPGPGIRRLLELTGLEAQVTVEY
jgi:anti-anti-sigma factor